jgi:hypothetical protein
LLGSAGRKGNHPRLPEALTHPCSRLLLFIERHIMFPIVYHLIELAMFSPVTTATVERAFPAMKIIETELRNKMSDGWLND